MPRREPGKLSEHPVTDHFVDVNKTINMTKNLAEKRDAFGKLKSGRIAVKVINHLGDEVMKVFRVG